MIHSPDSAAPGTTPDGSGVRHAESRLPVETRLGPVRLQVADVGRSLEYYHRVLGLTVADRAGPIATLTAHGATRPLVLLQERPGAAPARTNANLGLYHFAILLPTRADLGRFLRHLADVGERAGASDHHVSEALYLRDPDGLGIEVYADRPRSRWEWRGEELRMETVPLDAEAVLREGGRQPWRGMPPKTVMGHVHLHVGDLSRADAFYHGALGFERTLWSYPGALFLAAGGYHHHLGLNTWAGGALPAGEADARLLEWTLELPDAERIRAATARLEATGHPVEGTSGGSFITRDPWGTQLRLTAGGRGTPGGTSMRGRASHSASQADRFA